MTLARLIVALVEYRTDCLPTWRGPGVLLQQQQQQLQAASYDAV